MPTDFDSNAYSDGDIAIVGMSAHLPGAPDIETFWKNLESGTESIRKEGGGALKSSTLTTSRNMKELSTAW